MASRKTGKRGRPTVHKDGQPMSAAERQARRRKRVGKSINRTRRKQRKEAKFAPARAQREALRNAIVIHEDIDFREGDCREVLDAAAGSPLYIPDGTVALIVADPPYGDEPEPLYRWMPPWGARVLADGCSFLCWTGVTKLNRDIRYFDEHLTFRPVHVMKHTVAQRLFGPGVLADHKHILHYVKGYRRKLSGRSPLLPLTVKTGGGRDKAAHAWGQGDGGVAMFIEHLTEPGDLVIVPFDGTGMWSEIARAMGRRVIACDLKRGGTETIQVTCIRCGMCPADPTLDGVHCAECVQHVSCRAA
jgi:hypothetical protein